VSLAARLRFACAGLLLASAVACERQPTPSPPVLAPVEQDRGRVQFEGMQPCADCEGIRTALVLSREAGERGFVLRETYLAPQPVEFVSRGQWRRQGTLLHLEGEDGARLVYAVLDGGRLQPRDGQGRRLASSDGDGLLMPVASDGAP
jgi:hypothetical protein